MNQFDPNYNPKAIGEKSEGMVLAALLRAGKVVLQPFGDSQRYDLVVDEKGTFVRIQCKTARLRKGGDAFEFDTSSSNTPRTTKSSRGYKGQIELFGVYLPSLDKVYLVPVDVVGENGAVLRLAPPKNGQTKGVKFASDFELKFVTPS